ncbi:MAG TPA: M50 family metallopeptidase [Dehalococcoidia bacterium]|nr:M50 family metallopeptidase [Dehalococcoidia bacterium]
MNVLYQTLLPFLGIIVFLIVVHELGHFVTAKLAGVKVLEFGIGYPPRIWGVRRGETEYTINIVPLGGFVRLLGEEDPSDPRSLAAKPRWVRIIVLASGAGMNLVLAVFLFALALSIPREVDVGKAIILDVQPNSPAERAGLQPGDLILEVEGREIQNVGDVSRQVLLNLGEDITFKVKRGQEIITTKAHARFDPPNAIDPKTGEVAKDYETCETLQQGATGITVGPAFGSVRPIPEEERLRRLEELRALPCAPPNLDLADIPQFEITPFTEVQREPPWTALKDGVRISYESLILARNEVIRWITGGSRPQLSGPVGIAQATGEVVEEAGWKSLTDFAGLLSINLAILNILPLPMLDGGRVVFVLLEVLRGGRRIAPQKEAMVHFIGLVALLTFAVVITYFDILRIFEGRSLLQ